MTLIIAAGASAMIPKIKGIDNNNNHDYNYIQGISFIRKLRR